MQSRALEFVILVYGIFLGFSELAAEDLENGASPRLESFRKHNEKRGNARPDAANARIASTPFTHESPVVCATFSPDSKVLASSARNLRLWSLQSGREMQHFSCEGLGVRQIQFSPDGKYLAVLGKEMRLFRRSTGRELCRCPACSDSEQMMMFSPDSKNLAVVASDKSIRVWHTATGNELRRLRGSSDPILGLCFCKKENYLASIQHRKLTLWDPTTGKHLKQFSLDVEGEGSYTFSPDGGLLAFKSEEDFAHEEGSKPGVKIWETATGRLRFYFAGDFSCLVFSPDSKRIGCVYFDFEQRYAEVWDLKTGKSINQYRVGHKIVYLNTIHNLIASAVFSPDSKVLIITWSDLPRIERWDVATGALLKSYSPSSGLSLKFSPDGNWLAAIGEGNTIEIWNNRTGQLIRDGKGE